MTSRYVKNNTRKFNVFTHENNFLSMLQGTENSDPNTVSFSSHLTPANISLDIISRPGYVYIF